MEEKLKQKLKEEQRASIISGAVTCAFFCAFIIIAIVMRAHDVKNGNTETKAFLNFGSICLIVIFMVVFVKKILLICLDLTKGDEKYEKLIVTVVQLKKGRDFYGNREYHALVENHKTGERFVLLDCGNMEENETYYMLRAKTSKLYAYEKRETDQSVPGWD